MTATATPVAVADLFRNWAGFVGKTLEQELEMAPLTDISVQDAYDAYLTLADAKDDDNPMTDSRRRTCGAIANSLARDAAFKRGNGANLSTWFGTVADHAEKQAADAGENGRGRWTSIAATARREQSELQG